MQYFSLKHRFIVRSIEQLRFCRPFLPRFVSYSFACNYMKKYNNSIYIYTYKDVNGKLYTSWYKCYPIAILQHPEKILNLKFL